MQRKFLAAGLSAVLAMIAAYPSAAVVEPPVVLVGTAFLPSGAVYNCADPASLPLEGLVLCAAHGTLVLEHPAHSPNLDHPINDWSATENNPDGTVRKSCGEWHSENGDNFCQVNLGATKTITANWIFRCKSGEGGVCAGDHATSGSVHSYLIGPITGRWWDFNNGADVPGCNGVFGSNWQASGTTGSVTQDTGSCWTPVPKGNWGAGITYWP